jgi:hypothetical protein
MRTPVHKLRVNRALIQQTVAYQPHLDRVLSVRRALLEGFRLS